MSRSRQEKKWRTSSIAAYWTLDMSLRVHRYRCRQTVRAGLYKWLYANLAFVDHALTVWIQGFPGIDVTTDLKEHDSRTSDAPRDRCSRNEHQGNLLTVDTKRCMRSLRERGVDCIGTSGDRHSLSRKEWTVLATFQGMKH